FLFNPVEHSFYPICWFYRSTGLLCPGCGGLRALHQLSHGHVLEALRLNTALVAGLPFVAVYAWRRFLGGAQSRGAWLGKTKALVWAAGALLMLFAVLRNLPPFDWLRP